MEGKGLKREKFSEHNKMNNEVYILVKIGCTEDSITVNSKIHP